MTDDDPLHGADVGETRTVTETQELYTVDFEPEAFWGTDRYSKRDITNVEIVETDDGSEVIRLTWEGEVTKTLPYRWDHLHTDTTKADERGLTGWKKYALKFGVGYVLPLGITGIVAHHVMNATMSAMTINGEAV